jgi:uncharacterized protein
MAAGVSVRLCTLEQLVTNMYELTIPTFQHYLNNLRGLLRKAMTFCDARQINPDALLDTRLFPDMFTLYQQVRGASYHALACAANLLGQTPPEFDSGTRGFPALLAEIDETTAILQSLQQRQFTGAADRRVTLHLRRGAITMSGQHYVTRFALPNFFFHVTTAYNILRHCGVEIGKPDFLGNLKDAD